MNKEYSELSSAEIDYGRGELGKHYIYRLSYLMLKAHKINSKKQESTKTVLVVLPDGASDNEIIFGIGIGESVYFPSKDHDSHAQTINLADIDPDIFMESTEDDLCIWRHIIDTYETIEMINKCDTSPSVIRENIAKINTFTDICINNYSDNENVLDLLLTISENFAHVLERNFIAGKISKTDLFGTVMDSDAIDLLAVELGVVIRKLFRKVSHLNTSYVSQDKIKGELTVKYYKTALVLLERRLQFLEAVRNNAILLSENPKLSPYFKLNVELDFDFAFMHTENIREKLSEIKIIV